MRLYKHGTYLIHNCIVLVLLEEITDKIIKYETSARRPILRIYTAQYNHCNCLEQLLKAHINLLYINYHILNIARACVSQKIVEELGDRAVGGGGEGPYHITSLLLRSSPASVVSRLFVFFYRKVVCNVANVLNNSPRAPPAPNMFLSLRPRSSHVSISFHIRGIP